MSHFLADPTKLQLEISSLCNALCLGCVRTDQSNFNQTRKRIPKKNLVSLETFKQVIMSPSFYTLTNLDFCGTIDDPMMHPDFFKMLEFAYKWNEKFSINVHSNGSIRSKDDWKQLARILQKFQYEHRVRFSIDGLEDTHHIYRQNTDYNKILDNAKAFIDAGGIAVWQFISFPWNEHQIDDARKISKELGFSRFDLRRDRSNVSNLSLSEIRERKKIGISKNEHSNPNIDKFIESYKDIENLEISCNNQDKGMYFISNDSRLWPCCFIPNGFHKSDPSHVKFLTERLYGNYGKDFNDLTKYTVDEILENDFFMKDLTASWNNNLSTGPCGKITRCAETCNIKTLQVKPISSRQNLEVIK